MNKTNESNTQGLKLDNFKNIEKIGLKAIIQDKKIWKKVSEIIHNELTANSDTDERLYKSNNKLWEKIINFNHDFEILKSLKTAFESGKLDIIYTEYLSNRSDYNGNHGQITMQYPYEDQDGKLRISQIRLHCLGVKETKNGFVYLRHGGNYSFEHDVVSSLNYFLFGTSEGFKHESL